MAKRKNIHLVNGLEEDDPFELPSEDISHYAVVVSYTKNKLILNDPYNWEGFKIDNKNF